MVKYFKVPFAVDGNRATVPNDVQVDGSVSYEQGYPIDYSLDPETNPEGLTIERTKWNQLQYDVTAALKQYQETGIPDFITTSDNDGSPFEYTAYSLVRYDAGSGVKIYQSLVDNNDTLPTDTTKWAVLPLGFPNNYFTGAVTAGSANAQTLAVVTPDTLALADGATVVCTAGFTNSSTTTFNANDTGNVNVKKNTSAGLANLAGGEIVAGNMLTMTYNEAGTCWVLNAAAPWGSAAYKNTSFFLQVANNLSDLASTLTALGNLGFSGGTGWFKFPDLLGGWIVQFGIAGFGSPTGQVITFPRTFPNACWAFVGTADQANSGGTDVLEYVGSPTTSQQAVQLSNATTSGFVSGYCQWFAAGK